MQSKHEPKSASGSSILWIHPSLFALSCIFTVWLSGCHQREQVKFASQCEPCQTFLQQVEYPDLIDENCSDGTELMTGPPMTIADFQELSPIELTLEECVEIALRNSKIMQKLGGAVVNAPQAVTTLYDQALVESNPFQSVEAALSAYDATLNSSLLGGSNNSASAGGFFGNNVSKNDNGIFTFDISKATASGATFSLRNETNYNYSLFTFVDFTGNPQQNFGGGYDMRTRGVIRQPLGRGAGTLINRIAGPNATPGNYNGVLVARIRSDITLAQFEASVRDLVRDVVVSYWELYFGYRDLDTKITARDAAREVWENRKLRLDNGVGRPDDEAESRRQYYDFQLQAQNALAGGALGQPGVLGADRELRRLLGLPVQNGDIIRPVTEPDTAPIVFDWQDSQVQALGRRVELRQQKWTIRQRELELIAARQLKKWQFDFVADYGAGGFGPNLFGPGSAVAKGASVDDWQVGFEYGGAIGNRQAYLAIRNAELGVQREKAILKEQQRQILQDLSAAFVDVNRAYEAMKTIANIRIAALGEYEPKLKRVEVGQDQIFFLLNAQQQLAAAESNVFRAIKNYNQALMNYSYTTGSLLSRYNIVLTEAPWTPDAYKQARENARRIDVTGPQNFQRDSSPVSRGPYDQQMPGPAIAASTPNSVQPYDALQPDDNPPGDFPLDEIMPDDGPIEKGNGDGANPDLIDVPGANLQGSNDNAASQTGISFFKRFRKD